MAIYLIDKVKQKNDGKFFLMDAIDVEYNGKSLVEALAAGDVEVNGADGGTNWYIGETAPDAEVVAKEGDFYLNTTTYDLYKHGASEWELIGSIKGADGEKGDKGDPGEKGEKGETGAPFTIAKVYNSIEAMNAGYADDGVAVGSFVAIDTGNVEDEDNAKLYLKGDSAYTYITDMSGATGLQGPTGEKGETGEKGDKGVSLRMKGAWVTGTAYVNDAQYVDLVTNGGNTYAAVDSHTAGATFADDSAHWTLVAEKGAKGDTGEKGETGEAGADGQDGVDGEKGDTGVSMRMKGTWAADTNYVNDAQYIDVVVNNGAAYACQTTHTSTASFDDDAANWLMIAAKGAAGADGLKGDKGEKGDPFSIAKIYDSVANMNAGYATDDVPVGGFVLIETGNVQDADNAKLYVKGEEAYVFLTDMSGATGLQGPAGEDGADGEKGDAGVSMRLKGDWTTGTEYVNDAQYIDIVTNGGNTYAAKDSHTAGTSFEEDAAHWTMIAAKGAQGDQGIQGVTPTIGENGNWFIGEEDTGKPSRGDGVEEGITDRVETLEDKVAQLLYVAPAINSFTNNVGTKEKGATVTSVTFNWTLNKPMTKVEFNGTEEADAEGTTGTKTLTEQSITSDTNFTLKVTDEKNATATKTTSIVFRNGLYTGVSSVTEDAQINNAFVQGMTKALTNTRKKTFTVTAGEGEYIYFIIPTSFGTPAFKVGGFEGGFNKVKTFDYQNVEGYTESYDVWRSTNANLGNTTVEVS